MVLDIFNALLDRGADLTLQDTGGWTTLRWQGFHGNVDVVARLLQDRVSELLSIFWITTAIQLFITSMVATRFAGCNPTLTNKKGMTPLDNIRNYRPIITASIALFEEALADAEKTPLLVKALPRHHRPQRGRTVLSARPFSTRPTLAVRGDGPLD